MFITDLCAVSFVRPTRRPHKWRARNHQSRDAPMYYPTDIRTLRKKRSALLLKTKTWLKLKTKKAFTTIWGIASFTWQWIVCMKNWEVWRFNSGPWAEFTTQEVRIQTAVCQFERPCSILTINLLIKALTKILTLTVTYKNINSRLALKAGLSLIASSQSTFQKKYCL